MESDEIKKFIRELISNISFDFFINFVVKFSDLFNNFIGIGSSLISSLVFLGLVTLIVIFFSFINQNIYFI